MTDGKIVPFGLPFATPFKFDWVGLTEDEIKSIISNLLEDDPTPLLTLADVIQERLKEKNGG